MIIMLGGKRVMRALEFEMHAKNRLKNPDAQQFKGQSSGQGKLESKEQSSRDRKGYT